MEDTFQNVEAGNALLPIFRSDTQADVLAALFLKPADGGATLTQLAARSNRPLSSVHREVERLERAGILSTRRRGNLRLVVANRESPFYRDLLGLILRSVGPVPLLTDLLRPVTGVHTAYIFGSWAARYRGESGEAPADIDLLIVGSPDLPDVYAACAQAEELLAIEVNPTLLDDASWADPQSQFARRLKQDAINGVLLELALRPTLQR